MTPADSSAPSGSDALRELLDAVAHTRFGDVRWVASTGSTNTDVIDLAREGEPEGIVVVADHQTAGRGRRGRTWEAPPGAALMFTVLLRPPAPVASWATMAVAVAASDAVLQLTGVDAKLKWPNDLVWAAADDQADRKLAGILAEADWPTGSGIADGWREPRPHERVSVAVGIGINVAWGDGFPPELAETAVALDGIVGPAAAPTRESLLTGVLLALDSRYASLLDHGPDPLREAWRQRSATLGRRVRVDLGADDLEGTAVDVDAQGRLIVETVEGDRRTLAVGDVVHLRPLG